MTVERERRTLALAERALALPPEERARWLEEACRGDDALRAGVEAVLAADAADKGFLRPPTGRDVTQLLGRSPPPLPAGTRIGSYVIENFLARGGMGSVYTALQDRPHRRVALKVMSSSFASSYVARRFAFEAEALGRLRHAGIAQIFEAGTHEEDGEDVPFIAMEYIEGARSIVEAARTSRLKLRARLLLLAEVCDAIEHGHQRGLIHRDLKPGNILVDAQGQAKVIDFGIARAIGVAPGHTTMVTEAGAIVGTLGYNSPEQLAGDPRHVDARSDVYALGVVLYELVCGRKAFPLEGLSLADAMQAVKRARPQPPSSVHPRLPHEVDVLVARAMAKAPEERFPSAAALAAELRRLARRRPAGARAPSPGGAAARSARRTAAPASVAPVPRRDWIWRAAGLLLVGLLAVLVVDRVRLGQRLEALRNELAPESYAPSGAGVSVAELVSDLLEQSRAPERSAETARLLLEQAERLLERVGAATGEEARLRRLLAQRYRELGLMGLAVSQDVHADRLAASSGAAAGQ